MAKQIPDLQIKPRIRYPWTQWTDGHAWLILRGEDYTMSTKDMRAYLYNQATRRGLEVSTSLADGREGIAFQFRKPSKPAQKRKVIRKRSK